MTPVLPSQLPSNRSFGWTFAAIFALGTLVYPWALAVAAILAVITATRADWLAGERA